MPTYGEIESNLSEQANNWMSNKPQNSQPLEAFYLYFIKLGEFLSERRQGAATWLLKTSESSLVPRLEEKRSDLAKASKKCKLIPCMGDAYIVQHLGPVAPGGLLHPWCFVDLPDLECTCGNWKDEEFPCVHAIRAVAAEGKALETLYDAARLSVGHFRDTYSQPFKP